MIEFPCPECGHAMILVNIDFSGMCNDGQCLSVDHLVVKEIYHHCNSTTIRKRKYSVGGYNRGCKDEPNEYKEMRAEIEEALATLVYKFNRAEIYNGV